MPNDYLKSLSNKHNIGIDKLESSWIAAKKQVNKDDYSKEDYYKIVTYIFKKIINKRFDLNEKVMNCVNFKQFKISEDIINHYDIEEMPSKDIQQDNQEEYIKSNQ